MAGWAEAQGVVVRHPALGDAARCMEISGGFMDRGQETGWSAGSWLSLSSFLQARRHPRLAVRDIRYYDRVPVVRTVRLGRVCL
jgi:hypothetical protein